jgi:hypothetical protein
MQLRPFFRFHGFVAADKVTGVGASAHFIHGNDHAANMAPETVPFLDGLLGNLGYLVSGFFYDFLYRHK